MTPVQKAKRLGINGLHIATVLVFTLFTAFPFYWMLIITFKQTSDLMTRENNPFLFNEPPTLEHLRVLFFETLYGKWLWNTAWVGAIVVVITLLLAVPAGYALARLTGRWGEQLGIGIFLTYLVPPTLVARPGLPELHDSLLHLAPDGFLQGHSPRPRGSSHDRWIEPLWGVREGRHPPVGRGGSHRSDL